MRYRTTLWEKSFGKIKGEQFSLLGRKNLGIGGQKQADLAFN